MTAKNHFLSFIRVNHANPLTANKRDDDDEQYSLKRESWLQLLIAEK